VEKQIGTLIEAHTKCNLSSLRWMSNRVIHFVLDQASFPSLRHLLCRGTTHFFRPDALRRNRSPRGGLDIEVLNPIHPLSSLEAVPVPANKQAPEQKIERRGHHHHHAGSNQSNVDYATPIIGAHPQA